MADESERKKFLLPNLHHPMQNSSEASASANILLRYGVPDGTRAGCFEELHHHFPSHITQGTNLLGITLGVEMNDGHDRQLLAFLNQGALVFNWGGILITADEVAWTPERAQRIQQHLPGVAVVAIRIINHGNGIETTPSTYDDNDFPPLTTSSASVPLDGLCASNVEKIFGLPGLETLIVLRPQNPASLSKIHEFQQELLRALHRVTTLKEVTIPLDFLTDVKEIIEALKDHKALTSLQLKMPSSFNLVDLEPRLQRQLENALLTSLEPFPQLEELIVGRAYLKSSTLFRQMGRRMFDSLVYNVDGETVCFEEPARDLMCGKLFF